MFAQRQHAGQNDGDYAEVNAASGGGLLPMRPLSWAAVLAATALLACVGAAVVLLGPTAPPAAGLAPPTLRLRGLGEPEQHIYIVRHGDKYSSYPDCALLKVEPCFDRELMGDNPPLTPCGIRQAEHTAAWLQEHSKPLGGIQNIVVSPYTRTLQTSLPLASALDKQLKVEYLLSEANQPEGPHREFNIDAPPPTVPQLERVHERWDLSYGSVPIPTPENNTLYVKRVVQAATALRKRFPPSSGNLAVYTHATTSFSVAYGLCYGSDSSDAQLQKFVEGQDAIAPAGVIHVVLSSTGECLKVDQTQNVAEEVGCGKTDPFKCPFADYPSWYWSHSLGKGPGKCH